ncbi:MAG: deoxyribonuclease V [Acetobacteraceae bacterium]|nr:deoxyribonuclease V [Acetobacteraceae bacterium]
MALDTSSLRREQQAIAGRVSLADELPAAPRLIAGADVSATRFDPDGRVYAAMVVLEWPSLREVARAGTVERAPLPYIPGLLGFREIPALRACWDALPAKPELIFVDGMGILHPRRCGIASHLGVVLDVPTIGVGKSRLVGDPAGPLPDTAGASVELRVGGEVRGALLRSKPRANPLWISPGHRVSVAGALGWVRATLRGYRLPEPTRLAHLAAGAVRRG